MPDLVVWMIGLGEKQGTLGASLHQMARNCIGGKRSCGRRCCGLCCRRCSSCVWVARLGGLFLFGLMTPLVGLLEGLSGGGRR